MVLTRPHVISLLLLPAWSKAHCHPQNLIFLGNGWKNGLQVSYRIPRATRSSRVEVGIEPRPRTSGAFCTFHFDRASRGSQPVCESFAVGPDNAPAHMRQCGPAVKKYFVRNRGRLKFSRKVRKKGQGTQLSGVSVYSNLFATVAKK